jgi:hypothetical protein
VLLADFLSSVDERVSSDLLAQLIDEQVQPLVVGLIRNKLLVSLRPADESDVNQDAWIDKLEAYVKTVAAERRSTDSERFCELKMAAVSMQRTRFRPRFLLFMWNTIAVPVISTLY